MQSKMIALFDREGNKFTNYPIYQGSKYILWRDDDFQNMYFCTNSAGEIFEIELQEVIDIFGVLPNERK